MNKTEEQLQECYEHMRPYMRNENCTRELREMCQNCEVYCGLEHEYEECRQKPCFRFWLAYKYIGWCNAF